jgi:valyl-tRNA synthetase
LGWPDKTPDLKYFYPTSIMETGYDILFFWVARMIMAGLEFMEDVPFSTVYLHGIIRDEQGQKMSKSKGNVVDPLGLMDEWGTDALRFTLLVGSTPGKDMSLALKKVESNRNFTNKIWNASRFTLSAISAIQTAPKTEPEWTLADSWIWARLQNLVRDVERLFQTFQYGQAGQMIYDFFWSDFADWYVETAKQQLSLGGDRAYTTAQTLARVLDISLRLLHPFMPFVTEELWGYLHKSLQASPLASMTKDWPVMLIVAPWPEPRDPENWEEQAVADFTLVQDIVRAIRNLRAEQDVKPGKKLPAVFVAGDRTSMLIGQKNTLALLASLDGAQIEIRQTLAAKPEKSTTLVVGPVEIYLSLAGVVDSAEERTRLEKDLAETESQIARLETLLDSDFANKAPAAVVNKEREKLASYKETAEKIKSQLG